MPGRAFLSLSILVLLLAAWVTMSTPARAEGEPLLVDLLPRTIKVDSSFTGATVILFGVKSPCSRPFSPSPSLASRAPRSSTIEMREG